MTMCQHCWNEARRRHISEQSLSITDHYHTVLDEAQKDGPWQCPVYEQTLAEQTDIVDWSPRLEGWKDAQE